MNLRDASIKVSVRKISTLFGLSLSVFFAIAFPSMSISQTNSDSNPSYFSEEKHERLLGQLVEADSFDKARQIVWKFVGADINNVPVTLEQRFLLLNFLSDIEQVRLQKVSKSSALAILSALGETAHEIAKEGLDWHDIGNEPTEGGETEPAESEGLLENGTPEEILEFNESVLEDLAERRLPQKPPYFEKKPVQLVADGLMALYLVCLKNPS